MTITALKILASVPLVVAFAGVWLDSPALKWSGWIGFFPPAEALGFLGHGGTFSSYVWYLRSSKNPFLRLLGALICALFLWCGGYHFVAFRDWTHRKFKFAVDGIILISGALLSLISGGIAGNRDKPQT